MLKGYRHIGLAIGLIYCCLIYPAKTWADANARAHENTQAPKKEQPRSESSPTIQESVASIARTIKGEAYRTETPEEKRRAEDNLAAQQKSATGAIAAAIAAWLSLVVSAAGLIYLILTVRYTKQAVGHAETQAKQAIVAANAAIESVKVTQKIGEATVRAYFESHRIDIEWQGKTKKEGGIAVVRFKNIGQTPAINCTGFIDFEETEHLEGDPVIEKFESNWQRGVKNNSIQPQEAIKRPICSFSEKDLLAFEAQSKRIFILSIITYDDVFGNSFIQSCCSEVLFPKSGEPNVIKFRAYSKYNFYRQIENEQ